MMNNEDMELKVGNSGRREFLKGTGAAIVGGVLLMALGSASAALAEGPGFKRLDGRGYAIRDRNSKDVRSRVVRKLAHPPR